MNQNGYRLILVGRRSAANTPIFVVRIALSLFIAVSNCIVSIITRIFKQGKELDIVVIGNQAEKSYITSLCLFIVKRLSYSQ